MPTVDWKALTIGWLVNRRFDWPDNLPERRQRQLGRDPAKIEEMKKYGASLEAMDLKELNALYDGEKEKHEREEEAKQQATTARLAREAAGGEAKYAYNLRAGPITYDYWSKASYWTLNEAIMLMRGRCPEYFDEQTLKQNVHVSAFAGEFARLKTLAQRAVAMKQLHDPIFPPVFLAWVQRLNLPVEPALVAAVEARGLPIADWQLIADQRGETIEPTRKP